MQRFFLRFLLVTLSLSIVIPSDAASLMEVFQQALKSDPTFQAAGEQRLAETQNIPIARSLLLPQIFLSSANSLYNVQDNQTEPTNQHRLNNLAMPAAVNRGTFKYNSNGYTVNLSQVIFDYEAWAAFQQAKLSVKAADATYAAAAQNLISRVASAYFAVLLAEDELRYIQAEKKAVAQQLEQVLQQYKVGLVAVTGVYQAQAQYDRTVAQEITAKNNIINAKENLRAITGVFYDQLDGLKPNMPLVMPLPDDVDEWAKMSQRLNWTLQAAGFTSAVAKQQIEIENAGHLPVVNAVGQQQLTRTGTTPSGKMNTDVSSVGIQLELPVYQGGFVTAETKQARYNYHVALDKQEQILRNVVNLTYQSYNNITNGISKIKADERAIISGESSLRSTIEAYKVGTQTMLDVLQAQQGLFDTFRVYANDQYSYINATITLKEAAGILNIQDLEAINQLLTDTENTFSYVRTQQLEQQPLAFKRNGVPPKNPIGKKGILLTSPKPRLVSEPVGPDLVSSTKKPGSKTIINTHGVTVPVTESTSNTTVESAGNNLWGAPSSESLE